MSKRHFDGHVLFVDLHLRKEITLDFGGQEVSVPFEDDSGVIGYLEVYADEAQAIARAGDAENISRIVTREPILAEEEDSPTD